MTGFVPALTAPEDVGGALLFAFQGDKLLLREDGALPEGLPFDLRNAQYLGSLNGRGAFGTSFPGEAPAGYAFKRLRNLYGKLPEGQFALAGYAYQIVEWERTHRFCGHCGALTEAHPTERARRCPNCGLTAYPRLAPAVIVLVRRGPELLLARSPHFPPGMYSAVAGFVEVGETLEQAVRREVREEVALELGEVRYFGSQPWPFPHSLMVGFTADYAGGEIQVDGVEIEDAGWFFPDALPAVPGHISIARALIDAAVSK